MGYEQQPGTTGNASTGGSYEEESSTGSSSYPVEYLQTTPTGSGYSQQPGVTANIAAGGEYDNLDTVDSLQYNNIAAEKAAEAAVSASSASTSAATATTQADNASNSASSASTSAIAAATSATSASNSATTSTTQAGIATTQAGIATTQAGIATTQAGIATTAASTATTQAGIATTQAANASNSATAASISAINAATSATSASTSASTATTQAGIATTQAGIATTQATNAATSATSASGSATTATTQAGIATTQAGIATTQAGIATTQAGVSTTQAGIATTQASNAASSAAAAETARDQALAAFDNFDDKYLGEKTSDPTVDNDGNPLQTGALYFNNVDDVMKVYTGSLWVAAYVSGTNFLAVANNLSDLQSVSTARTNLGLGTAAITDSTAYATAAQGTKADTALQTVASADGSILITTTGTSIDLAVSQTSPASVLVEQVRNTTGATLTKGTAVYISGVIGQLPTVSKALATGDSTSAQTLGLITSDIANNSNGYVTITGLVANINTSAYTDGDQLYLSPITAGALTATKPYAPQHLVYMAIVAYAHPTQGKLIVKVQNGYEMDELHDVAAQSPTTGQTLVYNTSTSLWEKSFAPVINGTTINNTSIGATTANSGAFTSITASADSSFNSTGAVKLSSGTTSERPTGTAGKLRFNTTTVEFEGHNGTAWASVGGSTISNDISTATNLYPLFATTTTGTAASVYTSNAQYLFKPSIGELSVKSIRASNGIVVNSSTISANYTIATGDNAMSSGPISVNSGITITVSDNSRWIII
jgi:hypothetical protein